MRSWLQVTFAVSFQLQQVLEGHTDEIFSCAFNYEGNIIITGNTVHSSSAVTGSSNVISHVFVSSVSFLAPLLFLSSVFTREKTHLGICQIACVIGKVSYSWIIVAFEPAQKLWINAVTQTISEIWSQNLARVFIRFPEVIELMTFIFSFCIAPAILADLLFNT